MIERGRIYINLAFAAFALLLLRSTAAGQEDPKWDERLRQGVHAVAIGQYATAIEILSEVANDAKAFSPNDLRRAISGLSLATAYQYEGDLKRAEAVFLESKDVVEHADTPHPWLEGAILNGLGMLRYNQGRWKEAEEFLCPAAELCKKALGEKDSCAIAAMRNLGDVYLMLGRVNESIGLFQHLIELLRQTSPLQKDLLAGALRGLARAYSAQGQYALAEPLLQESLELNKQYGDATPIVGDSLVELAGLYRQENKLERAEPLLRKAVHIYEVNNDAHIAGALFELGLIAIQDQQYAMAAEQIEKSLEISEKIHGKDHLEVATAEAALAQAYAGEKNYKKAEPLVNEAMSIASKFLGTMHCGFAKLLVLAGTLKEKEHRVTEADNYYRQALNIFRRNLTRDHPDLMAAEHQYSLFLKTYKTDRIAFR